MLKIRIFLICLLLASQHSMGTSVEKQAKAIGFTACLDATKTVADFLIKKNAHSSHDIWSKKLVNERVFDSLIIKDYSDGDSHVSITVVPRGNECDWLYTETYMVEKPCQVLREERFGTLKYAGPMNTTTISLNNSKGLFLYLTPSETGRTCLVTKREVHYQ